MGIFTMARIVLGWTFRKPATAMYPAQPAKRTAISRGRVAFDGSTCISCRICMRKCPSDAICLDPKEKTWQIDRLRCIVCSSCVDTCPTHSLSMENAYTAPLSAHQGKETFPITYVKPEKPAKNGDAGGAPAPAAPPSGPAAGPDN